jgi:hypothetical protein
LPQNRYSHCWTLYMPTWSSLTPWRRPFRLIWFCGFPKCEIFFISFLSQLICLLLLSFCLFNSFQFSIFEFCLERFDIKIDWTIRHIGVTVGDNFLDKFYDFLYKLCDSSQIIWILYS